MHPDRRGLQLDVLLTVAEHSRDPFCRPVFLRPRDVEEDLGIFGRILHAHAAVAVGAHLVGEIILVRSVVLIYHETVEEVEAYAFLRCARTRTLSYRDVGK